MIKCLGLTKEEYQQLSDQLDKYHFTLQDTKPKVRFEQNMQMKVVDFLGCFECHLKKDDSRENEESKSEDKAQERVNEKGESSGDAKSLQIGLSSLHTQIQSNLSEEKYTRLGFQKFCLT